MPLPLTSSWRKKPATAIMARRPFWSSFLRTETKAERETRRLSGGHDDGVAATTSKRKDRDAGRGRGHLGEFLRVRGLEAGGVEADVAGVVLVLEACAESKFHGAFASPSTPSTRHTG